MIDYDFWFTFIGIAILLNIAPGPDVLYLAYKSFKSSGTKFNIENKQINDTFWKVFIQGVLIDILNPKVAIFFMAFLPQFIREGYGSIPF